MTKNITLAVDEATLKEVRRIALERDTTVNALVRDYFESLAKEKSARANTRRKLRKFFAKLDASADVSVGPITWTRDDLHER
jgi:hypothetical protein